jgi:8-oxo-dGTP diphosphatase
MTVPARGIPCVGAVVHHEGRLLVVQRGHEPGRGLWSVPGGRVEDGETLEAACAREVREECGIDVVVVRLAGRVERPAPDGATYVIVDLVCEVVGSAQLVAGDDADDARWVTRAELMALPCTAGLVEALDEWGVLPTA